MCDSILIKKSLEIFLEDYISPYEQCDVVISDRKLSTEKPLCFIGAGEDADIRKPFSRAQLVLGLEQFVKKHARSRIASYQPPLPETLQEISGNELKEQISHLTRSYVNDIVRLIESYYGKK